MNLDFRSEQAINGAREYERACRAARSTRVDRLARIARSTTVRRRVVALAGLVLGAAVTLVVAAQASAKPLASAMLRHEHLARHGVAAPAHAGASSSPLVLLVAGVAAVALVTLAATLPPVIVRGRARALPPRPTRGRERSRLAA